MRSRRGSRQLISLLITLVITAVAVYTKHQPAQISQLTSNLQIGSYEVVEFVDGDTIAVNMNGKTEKIRMIGVDTPETHDPRKSVECFGLTAAEYTKNLIDKYPVRLEADSLSTNRDRYNRLLRYVYTSDNRLVQAEIIKNGYGFAYVSFPFSKLEEFRDYERQAREHNKGLWSGCSPYLDSSGNIHTNPAQ